MEFLLVISILFGMGFTFDDKYFTYFFGVTILVCIIELIRNYAVTKLDQKLSLKYYFAQYYN
jgi:hypothetical protein